MRYNNMLNPGVIRFEITINNIRLVAMQHTGVSQIGMAWEMFKEQVDKVLKEGRYKDGSLLTAIHNNEFEGWK